MSNISAKVIFTAPGADASPLRHVKIFPFVTKSSYVTLMSGGTAARMISRSRSAAPHSCACQSLETEGSEHLVARLSAKREPLLEQGVRHPILLLKEGDPAQSKDPPHDTLSPSPRPGECEPLLKQCTRCRIQTEAKGHQSLCQERKSATTRSASRVLPMPPAPLSVMRRTSSSRRSAQTAFTSSSRPMSEVSGSGRGSSRMVKRVAR
jgi:hypothetical protein